MAAPASVHFSPYRKTAYITLVASAGPVRRLDARAGEKLIALILARH